MAWIEAIPTARVGEGEHRGAIDRERAECEAAPAGDGWKDSPRAGHGAIRYRYGDEKLGRTEAAGGGEPLSIPRATRSTRSP